MSRLDKKKQLPEFEQLIIETSLGKDQEIKAIAVVLDWLLHHHQQYGIITLIGAFRLSYRFSGGPQPTYHRIATALKSSVHDSFQFDELSDEWIERAIEREAILKRKCCKNDPESEHHRHTEIKNNNNSHINDAELDTVSHWQLARKHMVLLFADEITAKLLNQLQRLYENANAHWILISPCADKMNWKKYSTITKINVDDWCIDNILEQYYPSVSGRQHSLRFGDLAWVFCKYFPEPVDAKPDEISGISFTDSAQRLRLDRLDDIDNE